VFAIRALGHESDFPLNTEKIKTDVLPDEVKAGSEMVFMVMLGSKHSERNNERSIEQFSE
jgi:hypothetical protein